MPRSRWRIPALDADRMRPPKNNHADPIPCRPPRSRIVHRGRVRKYSTRNTKVTVPHVRDMRHVTGHIGTDGGSTRYSS